MDTAMTVVSVTLFLVLAFLVIGGPAVLVDWARARRQEMERRQVALTDALDAHFGPIVSAVVRRPFWGPWAIDIALPFARWSTVGRVLALVHEVLSGVEGMSAGSYRVVLAPKHDALRRRRPRQVAQSPRRWAGDHVRVT